MIAHRCTLAYDGTPFEVSGPCLHLRSDLRCWYIPQAKRRLVSSGILPLAIRGRNCRRQGFQIQRGRSGTQTVQGAVERAIRKITKQPQEVRRFPTEPCACPKQLACYVFQAAVKHK